MDTNRKGMISMVLKSQCSDCGKGGSKADRLLIVDDERQICSILSQRLTTEGYLCTTVHTGKEALNESYGHEFSLILADIRMPEMNGIELLENVKTVNPNVPVIIMTGFPEIQTAVEAMRMGAYDFIMKPFDLDLVAFSVRRALEKKKLEEEIETYHKNMQSLVEKRAAKLQDALVRVKEAHLDSVMALTGAIDAKDPFTRGHSARVRRMSLEIGLEMGFDEQRLEGLIFGALLHDIGMIGIRDEAIRKQGPLTPEEYAHIKEHPLIGAKILEGISFFKDKISMVRNHHERFDGSGYPDGLAGMVIPLEVRVISVADAFDAMTSMRPYRKGMSREGALNELKKFKGKQFDPKVLEIFFGKGIYNLSDAV